MAVGTIKRNSKVFLVILITLLLALFSVVLFLQFTPEDTRQEFEDHYFSDTFDNEKWVEEFEGICNNINDCDYEDISKYIQKFTSNGVAPSVIPHSIEINAETNQDLILIKNAPFSSEQFWRIDPVLEVALNMGLLDEAEIKAMILIISEGDSEDFCSKLFISAPNGKGVLKGIDIETNYDYETYCHIRWVDTLMTLTAEYNKDKEITSIDDWEWIIGDVPAKREKVCRDLSGFAESGKLEFISDFGMNYVAMKYYFCGQPLSETEKQLLNERLSQDSDSPRVIAYKKIYEAFIFKSKGFNIQNLL